MPKIKKIYDNIVILGGKYKYEQEMLFDLSSEAVGYVILAEENQASLLVIGDPSTIRKNNKEIKKSKTNMSKVNVYANYFGSIISPFGDILSSKYNNKGKLLGTSRLDSSSPDLLDRVKLSQPLETGMVAIDSMIPIGKGQRELIIGDRSTGKSTIAINTIINQKDKNIKIIYVAIGQKRSSVINTYNILKKYNAHKNSILIFASPDSASEQFFASKIGMSMAEVFAYKGEDVLIVLDDLTKHANIYREISLSLEKNPGREAYPTDIFYQHSRLLERAGRFNEKYKNGSITCLPIVETIQGDVASVIPSNVISITDGQIFTSTDIANNGKFPAININLSVSRTGSSVQSKEMRQISKNLKATYLKLFDIKKFSDMSIDVSDELKDKIGDWNGINNLLVQYGNIGFDKEAMIIIIHLFKFKGLNEIKDSTKFANAFNNYCLKNEGAKKLIKKMKTQKYTNMKKLEKDINVVFLPLITIASGLENGIITKNEFEKLKVVK